jgi:hypothetical protein
MAVLEAGSPKGVLLASPWNLVRSFLLWHSMAEGIKGKTAHF